MTNLNYLLIKLLQEKTKREEALEEINTYLSQNDTRFDTLKETKKWLEALSKKPHKELSKCSIQGGYQIMTDSAILIARKTNHLESIEKVEEKDCYPNCLKIIENENLSNGVEIDLREIYNASQLIKNEAKTSINIQFNDYQVSFLIETLEKAYKIAGFTKGTMKVDLDKEKSSKKPVYFYNEDKLLIITPCMIVDKNFIADLWINDKGIAEITKTDKLAIVYTEKKEIKKEPAPKVIPAVKGIKDNGEKASRKQLSYLLLLTGKNYSEDMTKIEASKEITRLLKLKRA